MNQEKTTNWKRNVNMKRENRGSLDRISKFLSMILRHHPETIGIQLDEHGWADVARGTFVAHPTSARDCSVA